MPETRYIEEFDSQGNVINRIPYEVSDEQLLLERLEKECNEFHKIALDNIVDFDKLKPKEKDELLLMLAKFYIVAGVRLGLFVL